MSEEGCLRASLMLTVVVILAVVVFLVFSLVVWNLQTEEIVGTLVSTQIEGGETHFVFQHDDGRKIEVLENEDCLVQGKFNSSDFMIGLEVDSRYKMVVNGKRIPFLGRYRNIIEYDKQ